MSLKKIISDYKITLVILLLIVITINARSQFTVPGGFTGTNSPTAITVDGSATTGNYIGKRGNANSTAVGEGALLNSAGAVGYAAAFGKSSMLNFTAGTISFSSAFGYQALMGGTGATGTSNSAFGAAALRDISSGNHNTGIGQSSLRLVNTGEYNTGIGSKSLYSLQSGSYNVAVGMESLDYNNASNNTAVGYRALRLATGSNNIGIGYNSAVPFNSNSDQLSIQNVIYGLNMSSLSTANVGIGVIPTTPFAKLEIGGTLKINYAPPAASTGSYLFLGTGGIVSQATLPTNFNSWSLTGNTATVPGTTAGQNFLGTTDLQRLVIATNATERMTVLTNGNVGIGTQAPGVRLHVTNGAGVMPFPYETGVFENNMDTKLGVYNSNAGLTTGGSSIAFGYTRAQDAGGTYPGYEIQHGSIANNNFFLRFNSLNRNATGLVTSAASNEMVLNNGNVGIGLGPALGLPTAPTARLHTFGTVRFENLQVNTQGNLPVVVIDPQGNLFRANVTQGNRSVVTSELNQELENKVDQLQEEVKNLRSLVELMLNAKPNYTTSQHFNIYPNPATNNIRIEPNVTAKSGSSQYVEVRDIASKILITQVLSNKSANISLNESLANGTYLVVIYEDGKVIQTEKIQVLK